MSKEPHRYLWLAGLEKANLAPRCGARRKSDGAPCRKAAMANGRCNMHGGKSTGPRTPEGLARSRRASWKHGFCNPRRSGVGDFGVAHIGLFCSVDAASDQQMPSVRRKD
jgi:hypothetical protein